MNELGEFPLELYGEIAKYDIKILYLLRRCCSKLLNLKDTSFNSTLYERDDNVGLFEVFYNQHYRGLRIKWFYWDIVLITKSSINMCRLVIKLSRHNYIRYYPLYTHTFFNDTPISGRGACGQPRWDVIEDCVTSRLIYRFFHDNMVTYIHTRSLTDLTPEKLITPC
ncbi:hypothetical protein E24_00093 [Faustovirus]|nr:hypothetical protein PRJ_Fausto_00084 [Faustovirus]AMN83026.1 hypothetical protein E24_00093 [Faustovirus]AMN84011.1 hypothetical protein D5a_00093 [Faustovirus]AMN84996.1 hypothetical protein E23_00093 [Faustovirus]QBR98998.1 hypothetical protein [Faustovirus mariensis]